jgi:polyketide synthase 12
MAEEARLRQYLEKVTVDLRKAHRRVRDLEQSAQEPIAIVGMSCRFPGGVGSPQALWRLLADGADGISGFPADRGWDLDGLCDPDPDRLDSSYVHEGGFIDDAGAFDPGFFGIGPREAVVLDPQQRLLLESCWEALEDAGLDPHVLRGEKVGVFAGAMYNDYGWGQTAESVGPDGYPPTVGTGSAISGRLAYTLGLEGPAITIDTACSSSLVALHLAARALRDGECSQALAGGVTVFSTPRGFIEFSRQRALSPDGRCKSFAESADGVGFAEGVGMLLLERLSDAERSEHPVLATIRGSAVNQDGASNGLTAPNGPSQERVIRQALLSAGLVAKDVDAVEAHGTGTVLGDPIEAGALFATYGQDRERPLKLGSLKSNIGHAQAAAGVGGVIKMVMALREGVLPKTLHADAPSSKIDWEAGKIELLGEAEPWEPNGHPRRAGVSSFGASGTNAHLILEEAPARQVPDSGEGSADDAGGATGAGDAPLPGVIPLALSAKTEPALRESATRLFTRLEADSGLDPIDVAHSLVATRAMLEHRAVVTGSDRRQLLDGLAGLGRGEAPGQVAEGRARTAKEVAFLFPGQGSQWQGMGLELAERSPVFARHLEECEEALSPHIDFSVRDVLAGAEGAPSIDRVEIVQPVLFAVMVSLAELWRACGVVPSAVAGHSQGEVAAAHIAGGISLEDAALLAGVRSRMLATLSGTGGMASVALAAGPLRDLLGAELGELIEIAAYNGPSAVIVSAATEPLKRLLERCDEEGVRARWIPAAKTASHSAAVEVLRDELLAVLAPIVPRSGEIPFYSTVTGEVLDTKELGAEYWYRNLREPVRFEQVTRELLRHGRRALIEVSPHPVFALSASETVEDELAEAGEAAVLSTLRRDEGGPDRFALSLARAQVAGVKLDWPAFFAGRGKRVPLPTYPFQRKLYWMAPAANGAGDLTAAGQAPLDHPLLGAAIRLAGGEEWLLTGRVSLQSHPWLADHAVAGTVLFPGTGFVELALRAGSEVGCGALDELTLEAPLFLAPEAGMQVQLAVEPADERGRREIAIYSRPEGDDQLGGAAEWTRNARGILSPAPAADPHAAPEAWPPEGAEPLEVEGLYDRLADAGFEYGPSFQGLTAAWRLGEEVFAEVSLPEERASEATRFGLHPALLDSTAHAGIDLALTEAQARQDPVLPFAWRDVRLLSPGAASLRVRLSTGEGNRGLTAFDQSGDEVFSVGSVDVRPVDPGQLQAAARSRSLYRLAWTPAEPGDASAPRRLAILGEAGIEGIEAEHHAGPAELAAAIEEGGEAPALALADLRIGRKEMSLPEAAHDAATEALELLQAWLAEERLQGTRLALLTRGAFAASEGEDPDPASAAVAGLLRSAQSEHPGRFLLIDCDASEASARALPQALGADEPQLALREGFPLAPRLARAQAEGPEPAPPLDPDSTVLITGGTSGLGALFARHLVTEHGARNLLLASRRGPEAPGVEELVAELEQLGASVTLAACDVSHREQLQELLGQIPAEHPLGAVIHSAAVLDDGVLGSLDRERLQRVFAPKADAAWHLHELTEGMQLSRFVLFSSAAGLLGNPAQANYAAANAFLDALAAHRRAQGLPALSLAWGGWDEGSLAIADLSDSDRARLGRMGFLPMTSEQVLELFDLACDSGETMLAPVELNPAALRARAEGGTLPDMLRGIVRVPARRGGEAGSLAAMLSLLPEAEREAAVLGLVRDHAATVLGHGSAEEVDPDRAFQELGFDSLGAVELRNRLGSATGLRLAPTLVFDYPSAAALARHLRAEAEGQGNVSVPQLKAAASSEEPIAIVGMSCRFPGAAGSPRALWQLLAGGEDGIGALPPDRGWDLERLYDPDPDTAGASYARHGGFVEDVADFDPGFFGISPREALVTDPQQRLLLEASWEALEDAGIDPTSLAGSTAGIFAGAMYNDYGNAVQGVAPGMTSSLISGRVAYALGLQGPAMTIDTACSSSLVATHLAAGALRGGECSLALAGGVTVLSTPNSFVFFSRQRGLARDGRCKPFAEAADGIGISEGVGLLVLERLSDAERNSHRVLATIKGSAVNQDGASNGLTAPNGPSQERVIRQALANARLAPEDIDAIEAHGTGTTLGDPIEAGALLSVYGKDRERPLKLGSIKSNIGHAQAAAGVAGVIKMVMAMREGTLPKTLHAEEPSSKIDWEAGEIELLGESEPWQPNAAPRRAGVSSFGISGTNAHLILEEAPAVPVGEDERSEKTPEGASARAPLPGPMPILLSAKTAPALRAQAERLAAHLAESPQLRPLDVAWSLATTRTAFEHRAAVVSGEREQLLGGLEALA